MSNKIKLGCTLDNELVEYPDNLTISVEFSSECTVKQAVTGFKVFLKALEFSSEHVERVYYEPKTI